MSAVLSPTADRRRYRRNVESLLSRIQENAQGIRLLKVAGARGAALAERKRELARAREELAALVASDR